MTDQVVGVTNQSAGSGVALVDTSELTVNGKTVERQRVAIGDPSSGGRMVGVSAADGMQVDSAVGAANFLGGQTAMTGATAVQVAAARTGAPGTPLAITALTQAGGNSSSQQRINFRGDLLDVANGYRYFQLSITPSVAAALIAGVVQGVDPRYAPADGIAAATQTQIVG